MRRWALAFVAIIALFTAVGHAQLRTVKLSVTPGQPNGAYYYTTEFKPGAVGICVSFRESAESGVSSTQPDGHYVFHLCTLLNGDEKSIRERWIPEVGSGEWTIWSEVQYPIEDKPNSEVTTLTSNKVIVTY